MIRTLSVILALSAIFATCQARASTSTIEWQVDNPFRFFADPTDTEMHRGAAGSDGSILMDERGLSARHRQGWAADVFLKTCWHLFRQDHSACGGLDAYVNPRSHRITARLRGGFPHGATCLWKFEALGRNGDSWRAKSQPCSRPVTLDVPYPTGGHLKVSVDGANVAERLIRVRDLFIVGLGDSYASGDGNPDRPVQWKDDRVASFGKVRGLELAGYPQRKSVAISYMNRELVGPSAFWLSQPCHRSLYSHQLRVGLKIALETPYTAVTFLGLSCSGAEITSGLLNPWEGVEWFPVRPRRSQIGAAAVAQCGGRDFHVRSYASGFTDGGRVASLDGLALERCPPDKARKVDMVLLSIGGNDIGFAKLIAYSILSEDSPLRSISSLTDQIQTPRETSAKFPELDSRFKLLRRALHNHLHIPWNEPHRILLTAYPKIAMESDGRSVCNGRNKAGLDGFPAYRLDRRRVAEAETVSAALSQRLERIAKGYGWTFISEHRERFAGRGICAGHENGNKAHHDELLLPRWTGQVWKPYKPSDYAPYALRTRWMRTSNDAFMTAHIDASSDLRRPIRGDKNSYQPTDLLKASTFGGAFHPTAEGQAAIADALLPLARRIIRDQRP